jgi:transcriptional regulator with XRE-family HTH domain
MSTAAQSSAQGPAFLSEAAFSQKGRHVVARPGDDSPITGAQAFAQELKAQREKAGLTQEQLAARMGYSASVIAKLETCRTYPSQQHADKADEAFGTPGTFRRLRKVQALHAYPSWFLRWPEAEAEAQTLRWYEPLLVPGLLQTEAYAAAILSVQPDVGPERVEQQVSARMQRQEVLAKDKPPHLWCVIDEGVLHRRIGGREVMQDQLGHLARMSERSRVCVQVIPFGVGAHAGLLGCFAIAETIGQRDTLYLETATVGQVIEIPAIIARAAVVFDTLRSQALPRAASADVIMKVAETRWSTD